MRLIVERERERMAFVSATWWDLIGTFAKQDDAKQRLEATLVSVDGRKIPSGKDFDPATGKLKNSDLLLLDEAALDGAGRSDPLPASSASPSVEEKPYTTKPYAPFTTSTLQQEANRKLGFTARRTMQRRPEPVRERPHHLHADRLDQPGEGGGRGRPPSWSPASTATKYLPAEPRTYSGKVKNAQEAHEAIRPAGHPFRLPSEMKSSLNADECKIFDLIWKRTIASQMDDARGRRIIVTIEGGGLRLPGERQDDRLPRLPPGLRRGIRRSGRRAGRPGEDPAERHRGREAQLPWRCSNKDHTTQPPSRFSEASLTKALEEKGIGRPSTYASIIDTIQARNYVFKKGGALVPTWVAFSVVKLLEDHLGGLVDYQFTAHMEDDLDAISRGEKQYIDYLKAFYFGNGKPGLKKQLENKIDDIDPRTISRIKIGESDGEEVFVRVGKFSPFVEQGDRTASLPEETPPDEVKLQFALDLLEQAAKADEPLGTCPDTGKPVYIKTGRFGPYVQLGSTEDDEKPKNASLLKGMGVDDVDLATALKLLSLPREMGVHPKLEDTVTAFNGRYGPYVKCGSETRSLPADVSPLEVTLEQAIDLLNQPKTRGRAATKPPIKVFEESPVTGNKVQLLEGRYGPYVADGETNASLPKGVNPEELDFNEALNLLAARAAAGGSKKKAPKKKAVKKNATKKKTTKKATKKK